MSDYIRKGIKWGAMAIALLVGVAWIAGYSRQIAPQNGRAEVSTEPTKTPKAIESKDQALSIQFEAEIDKGGAFVLSAKLTNVSSQPLHVKQPFGDGLMSAFGRIEVHGPKGNVPYRGGIVTSKPTNVFVRLLPGDSVIQRLKLPSANYEGSDAPGEYRISYKYLSSDYDRQLANDSFCHPDLWVGTIETGEVAISR